MIHCSPMSSEYLRHKMSEARITGSV